MGDVSLVLVIWQADRRNSGSLYGKKLDWFRLLGPDCKDCLWMRYRPRHYAWKN